jgi:hypothetical protein
MAAGDLTTLSNAYGWVGAAPGSDDTTLERLITAYSSRIQAFLGYNVVQTSYTRTFNGQGTPKLYVPDIPLQSVQSLVIDAMPVPQGVISGNAQQAGFYNDDRCIGLIGYMFNRGFQNITAAYTAGLASADPALTVIEQACLDWVKIAYSRKTMPGIGVDVVSVKAGDTQINWAGKGSVTDPYLIPMPAPIYDLLFPYRRVTQISGF